MSKLRWWSLLITTFAAVNTPAAPTTSPRDIIPAVKLDSGTFIGKLGGGVSSFLGIPFALPPVGDLRFELPKPNAPYTGTKFATSFGKTCTQSSPSIPLPAGVLDDVVGSITGLLFNVIAPTGEDCLTLNVVTPSVVTTSSKLPVVVWIFGGGFSSGNTQIYDGSDIVRRSIALGSPVIYVTINYRLNGFGFMPGKEIKDAGVGNLGLQDQRLALRWIQKYISAFGGDSSKVTIWGESAGAISVASQMVANGGDSEGLFHAAVMQSGSPIPVGDIANGQPIYDAVVSATGCSVTADTLKCLKAVPFDKLRKAIDAVPDIFSYSSLRLPWTPRSDGVFFQDAPQQLVLQDKVANIPFITGDCDDEGTLFSLSTLNITTNAQLRTYLHDNYLPRATFSDVDQILAAYPEDVAQGSPFDTGIANAITPQFKRIAAINGDLVFQAPRRFFLDQRSGKQNTWTYLSKRQKAIPILGSFHASDLLISYGGELTDYIIQFATNFNPGPSWPKYDTTSRKLLTFLDGLVPTTIISDTYRQQGMEVLTKIALESPL